MKIYKNKKNLIIKKSKNNIITIPLLQNSYDAVDRLQGQTGNVIGMVDNKMLGFAQVIDLGYKDSFDYGDFIVKLRMPKKKFKQLCKKLDIVYFEWPICSICKKTIYGTFTIGKKGDECWDCNKN